MEFDIPKGTKFLKGRSDEKELIFPRGLRFRVVHVGEGKKVKDWEHIAPSLTIRAEVV